MVRVIRTQLHKFIVNKDTCMAVGQAKANLDLGDGGGTQYYVMPQDRKNLTPTGMVTDIK